MTSSCTGFSVFRRKKYVKNCQIQHSYGEEVDNNLVEEEALKLTQSAINEGSATGVILSDVDAPAPEGAVVEVGGKKSKWCGSNTHTRRSHKDCPHNDNNSRDAS